MMSDGSEDDLFSDGKQELALGLEKPEQHSSAQTPFRRIWLDSYAVTFSLSAAELEVHCRELGSNEEALLRLSLRPPPSPSHLIIRPVLCYNRDPPEDELVLDDALIAAILPQASKAVVALATPSGHLFFLPVDPQHLLQGTVLVASLGEPLVGLETVRVGEHASSVLVMLAASGRFGHLSLHQGGKLSFKLAQLSSRILHLQRLHHVLFCANGALLTRLAFSTHEEAITFAAKTFRLLGDIRSDDVGPHLVVTDQTASGRRVSFADVCRDPQAFLSPSPEAGAPSLSVNDCVSLLQDRAEALQRLQKEHAALDEALSQVNLACHLASMPLASRQALFEVAADFEPHGSGSYELCLELTNRLDLPLSHDWHLLTSCGSAAVECAISCHARGSRQSLRLRRLVREADMLSRPHDGVLLTCHLVLAGPDVLSAGHAGCFRVQVMARQLSLLDFLMSPSPFPGASSADSNLTLLCDSLGSLRGSGLSSAFIELHEGDRLTSLPSHLAWLFEESAARRDMRLFGVPVVLETASPVVSSFREHVRRIWTRCAAPRHLLGLSSALRSVVVRRKQVGAEELKKDLMLLQALCRHERHLTSAADQSSLGAFQDLLEVNSLLDGLYCV